MTESNEHGATSGRPLARADWLRSAPLLRIMHALQAEGGAARVVGGAVRNSLLGQPITDIDIATPLEPKEVMTRAAAAGLGVHPTGLEHGTVTLVADGHPFEVTTLRRDVETDGRRAVVAFSKSWHEDAERRDFTMNALYAAMDGTIFDYFGGLQDLAARRVRFIGSADQRIREDSLRILRFFRFYAQYGVGEPEPEGLAACVRLKEGMVRLSAERIGAELLKLLAAPGAARAIKAMAETSILSYVLGPRAYPVRLEKLLAIESALDRPADPLTRLAVLALDGPGDASRLGEHLRLSTAATVTLADTARSHRVFDPATPEPEARAWLYRVGADSFSRAALFAWAMSTTEAGDTARAIRARLSERWQIPQLPFRGADVLALGVPPGPKIGQILKEFESWWIEAGFPGDPALLRSELAARVAKS